MNTFRPHKVSFVPRRSGQSGDDARENEAHRHAADAYATDEHAVQHLDWVGYPVEFTVTEPAPDTREDVNNYEAAVVRPAANGRPKNGNCSEKRYQITWSLDRTSDVGRAMLSAIRRLREAEIETAQLDAAVLMAYVLGVNKTWVYAHPTRQLTEVEIDRYETLVRRRTCHEPVAYLVGYKAFYGLDITVDSRVLIPRPETELLVERAASHLNWLAGADPRPSVADIGTGSGAIAIALACNVPQGTVYAVDISEPALEVAAQNIWRYGLAEQVHLLPGHLLAVLPEPVDVIVANLPYVATGDLPDLPPQVRKYEPVLALDGGPDGLSVIAGLLRQLAAPEGRAMLKPGGRVYLEIGANQGDGIRKLVADVLPEATVEVQVDYAALDRLAVIEF